MKFALALLAIVGLAVATPDVQPRDLSDDFMDIAALIPIDQITEIVHKYIESDPDVQYIITYLQSEEWAELVAHVANHPTWIRFKEYLRDHGINIYNWAQNKHGVIAGLPGGQTRQTRSVQGMVKEIISLIPVNKLLILIDDKIHNSPDFKEFWDVISGPTAYAFAQELRYLPEVERLALELRQRGLEIDTLAQMAYSFLGWEF